MAAGDVFAGIEGLVGSAFADVLIGDGLPNALDGGAGDDRLYGLDGGDLIDGGEGADLIDGGAGFDTASYRNARMGGGARLDGGVNWGMAAGDVFVRVEGLVGSAFADVLIGDPGDNSLEGRGGVDDLWGLAGADRFAFTGPGFGTDIVRDFEDGVDLLDFSSHAAIGGFADLEISQAGSNLRIDAGADVIFLVDVALADITVADFEFA